MSLPPRIGGALVVLGDLSFAGQYERAPGHILVPPNYGAGNHEYFTSYPITTPSNVITKVWGLLGTEPGPEVTVTPATLPKNSLMIVCYKTELNHWFPDAAKDGLYNIDSFNSTDALYYLGDGTSVLNTGGYEGTTEQDLINAWNENFNETVADSFASYTNVTNILEIPMPSPGVVFPWPIYPRWTDEDEYDRFGYDINAPVLIAPTEGLPYFQTRTGTSTSPKVDQLPLDYISPWYVSSSEGSLYSELRIQCDYSYKFTDAGAYDWSTHPTEFDIVYPWTSNQTASSTGGRLFWLPDEASWQYSQNDAGNTSEPYPSGAYRSGDPFGTSDPRQGLAKPEPSGAGSAFVKYESKATHGLFLDADGSCWNLGTKLKVRVHIWKAPPKRCFYPNNENDTVYNGNAYAFTNFKRGLPGTVYREYEVSPVTINSVSLSGPMKGRGTESSPFYGFETGVPTQIDYSISSPKPVDAHYWGCVFTPDFDSDNCQVVEIKDFTVIIDETNTYFCDGGARPGITYTDYGVKIEDIELPTIEGFITYIKDFEVYEITKPEDA